MADDNVAVAMIEGTPDLPTVIGPNGLQPQSPQSLRAQLVTLVSKTNPDYTDNLPGSLIEDIASTDTQALVLIDSARVEALNDLTPYGCNAFVLTLLGKVYGVPQGQGQNTSVFVRFAVLQSNGTPVPGFVIGKGFTVSDGNHQYVVQDGGSTGADGVTPLLFAISPVAGSWAVPAGTVTTLASQPPTGFTITVVNPEPGLPAGGAETETQYRARVLTAGLAASTGMGRYLRTLLANVPGVQPRLIGIQQKDAADGGGWMIIVGGGDPYQVAYAIYMALFDISTLKGATTDILAISNANPALVSTDLNHGYLGGETIVIAGASPSLYNGSYAVLDVPSQKTFHLGHKYPANALAALAWAAGTATATTLTAHGVTPGSTFTLVGSAPGGWNGTFVATAGTAGTTLEWALAVDPGAHTALGQLQPGIANFDSTALAPWTSGGTVEPNARNLAITITDFPDTYLIRYVNPPQQSVTMTVTWNTSSPNFVSPAAVEQAAAPAIAAYINSIVVGRPINILQLEDAFQAAVEPMIPRPFLTVLDFAVAINGVGTLPPPGTKVIEGDPQSYFFCTENDINVVQG